MLGSKRRVMNSYNLRKPNISMVKIELINLMLLELKLMIRQLQKHS